METYFASPGRKSGEEIAAQSDRIVNHSVVSAMLKLVSGMLAILNSDRQVVALNDDLADYLGVSDLSAAFGLRPGEAVSCVHAHDMPAGCGTGPFCDSCEAAVAIVTSLQTKKPVTRKCAIETQKNDKTYDLFLQVQAVPVEVEGDTFVILFVQDISASQKWAAMEQVFFHDINNILAGVVSVSNLLLMESSGENRDMVQQLSISSRRITQEVAIQRCLLNSEAHTYSPIWSNISLNEVFSELAATFDTHPAAKGKRLIVPTDVPPIKMKTDFSLLLRVLNNMLVNAFEATDEGGRVVVSYRDVGDELQFSVWNNREIDSSIRQRLFQRNVSTKGGLGRGIGTYSMKLFGEEMLGGKVDYSTSAEEGTQFSLTIDKFRNTSVVSVSPISSR
ncbi:MAG: HAMP domain-containing histidine kinase [Deltaproteobacteria bacterium]|nr:HAMP domain-containing histidine kinase [Deltaproteobacteria bacterium]MBN2672487.1 HAMP domain-containing histidine kinase [Deltaproteobacteria bacterium]